MKIFKNKRIIKIIIYAVVCIIIRCNNHFSGLIKNDSLIRFLKVVELVLVVLASWEIFLLTKNRAKILLTNGQKFLNKKLKLFLNKIRAGHNSKRKYIKGIDENGYIWNLKLGIADKLKRNFMLRQKLKLKHGSSNTEKIKLLYIKFILIMTEKNYKVKYTDTPKEIKDSFDYKDNDMLFDIYEQVRYNDNESIIISDDMVKLCESITDEFR